MKVNIVLATFVAQISMAVAQNINVMVGSAPPSGPLPVGPSPTNAAPASAFTPDCVGAYNACVIATNSDMTYCSETYAACVGSVEGPAGASGVPPPPPPPPSGTVAPPSPSGMPPPPPGLEGGSAVPVVTAPNCSVEGTPMPPPPVSTPCSTGEVPPVVSNGVVPPPPVAAPEVTSGTVTFVATTTTTLCSSTTGTPGASVPPGQIQYGGGTSGNGSGIVSWTGGAVKMTGCTTAIMAVIGFVILLQ